MDHELCVALLIFTLPLPTFFPPVSELLSVGWKTAGPFNVIISTIVGGFLGMIVAFMVSGVESFQNSKIDWPFADDLQSPGDQHQFL